MDEYQSLLGRRIGKSNTRTAILSAATQIFLEKGYDHATMQAIAKKAGVDPALIVYFFKNKQRLFVEAVTPTYSPDKGIAKVLEGDSATVGLRYASYMVEFLEDPELGSIAQGLIRASVTEPAMTMLKDMVEKHLITTMVHAISKDDAELRASFVCSIYIGFVMARYINKIEPLASASNEAVVKYLAPMLQQCLAAS